MSAGITPGEALCFPEIAETVLQASQELSTCPGWDDFVELLDARKRLGVLSGVCRAWRARAQRLARSVRVVDLDEDAEGHLDEVETVVFAHRGPGVSADYFWAEVSRCPKVTTVYIHKPPAGIALPSSVRAFYTTGMSIDLLTGFRAPSLQALSMLQLNATPMQGLDFTMQQISIVLGLIGCGKALRSLTLHLFELDDGSQPGSSFTKQYTLLGTIGALAPNLRSLAFADEYDRSSFGMPGTCLRRLTHGRAALARPRANGRVDARPYRALQHHRTPDRPSGAAARPARAGVPALAGTSGRARARHHAPWRCVHGPSRPAAHPLRRTSTALVGSLNLQGILHFPWLDPDEDEDDSTKT